MAGGKVNAAGQTMETVAAVGDLLDRYGFPPADRVRREMYDHAGHVLARGGTTAEAVGVVEQVLANTYGPIGTDEGLPLEEPDGTLGL